MILNVRTFSKTTGTATISHPGFGAYYLKPVLPAIHGHCYGLTEIGKRLGMTQPGLGYAVTTGVRIADRNNYLHMNELII